MGFLNLLLSDQLYQVLLLEVEQEIPIIVQKLRVQLINQADSLFYLACLDTVSNADPIVQHAQILASIYTSLLLKPFSSILKPLCHQVVHYQLVHGSSRHPDVTNLLHPLLPQTWFLLPHTTCSTKGWVGRPGTTSFPYAVHAKVENCKATAKNTINLSTQTSLGKKAKICHKLRVIP